MTPSEGNNPDNVTSRPDPSSLTTENLNREVGRLEKDIVREILRLERLINGMVDGLTGIVDEKFNSVKQELGLIERQRVEQKEDTKAAVDAALTAQKEAVREQTIASEKAISKSESTTTKQLEQLLLTFNTAFNGVSLALDDLKLRVGKMEAIKQGGTEAKAGVYAFAGFIVTIIVIVSAIAAFRT